MVADVETQARLILQAQQDLKEFWDMLMEQFNVRIEAVEAGMMSNTDPWLRYAFVEAYKQLQEFQQWFQDVVDKTRPRPTVGTLNGPTRR